MQHFVISYIAIMPPAPDLPMPRPASSPPPAPGRPARGLLRLLLAGLVGLSVTAHAQDQRPLQTIASLDIARYMGTWHEIARYPNRFQRQCAGGSHARYTLQPEGRVEVINRCRLEDGSLNEAIGQARQVGGAGSPKLEVRFAPAWLSFIPAVWGNYWVVDLDPAYLLVAVSEPKREYLWVLSRTPRVEAGAYRALLERLERQGFDLGKLETTRQPD